MTSTTRPQQPAHNHGRHSPGADICHEAGLALPEDTPRRCSTTTCGIHDVVGSAVQMALYRRDSTSPRSMTHAGGSGRQGFDPGAARPNHDAVRAATRLSHPLHLTSCYNRLYEAGRSSDWLAGESPPSPHSTPTSAKGIPGVRRVVIDSTALSWASRARRPARCRRNHRPGRPW